MEFTGKVAVVTGAARGFGRAFCEALSARGAAVAVVDIDRNEAEAAAAAIRADGRTALAVACDVAEERQVADAFAQVSGAFGHVDILINNAGLHSAAFAEPMLKSGPEKLRRLFDVNLMGVINCSLAAYPLMKDRSGACILNISSAAGYACPTAYGVSKQAVRGLTVTMAREFGPDGVRVNAIAPGLIFTDTIRRELPQNLVNAALGQQVIRHEGDTQDVVEGMLYLCSSRAAFVSGETLRLSGGMGLYA